MRGILASTALTLILSSPASAADLALIVGNDGYERLPRNPAGDEVLDASQALERAGVLVISERNAGAEELDDLFGRLVAEAAKDASNRLAVILSGQFAETASDTYFLPVDAGEDLDVNSVRDSGLALSSVMALLAEAPGDALLVLGEERDSGELGAFLTYGVTLPVVPQGVTVLRGDASDVGDFVSEALANRSTPTVESAERDYGLIATGYLPAGKTHFSELDAIRPPAVIVAPEPVPAISEADLWSTARQADTTAAYQAYLDAFPDGPNAQTARAMINEIETEPFRAERLAEEALGLSRDARRAIQRNLTLLEFDPRGIDGIFGRGSRSAIAAWQRQNNFPATSFLTGNQIALLESQADRRAAELEEEARLRQEQQEREDRAYWRQTGALGDAPGLRAYLKRYPDGVFAELAQERLRVLEEAAQAEAAERERIAWEQASDLDTVEGYEAFIRDFPNGALAEEARARIDVMTRSQEEIEAEERAKRIEDNLGLNRSTRRVVEDRLAKLGLKPGRIDGEFDDDTRRAIRRYQDARGLSVTGYLNQNTVVRLMADSLFR